MANTTDTYLGSLNALSTNAVSSSAFIYCESSVSADTKGSVGVPCPVPATTKVHRPYLAQSIEKGRELSPSGDGVLPDEFSTVTTANTFNNTGDPLTIIVATAGAVLGQPQTVTKTTTNMYASDTSADYWVLGRLTNATQRSQVVNIIGGITPSAGSAPLATATQGVATGIGPSLALGNCTSITPTLKPTQASMTCIVTNVGGSATSSISYSTIVNATVNATTTGVCAPNAVCGAVTVTSAATAGTYSGTLTATPNSGTSASVAVSLQVTDTLTTLPALVFGTCTSVTPTITGTSATMRCPLSNAGQTAANRIAHTTIAGTTVSGPIYCAANAACVDVLVTTSTDTGAYTGTLSAMPDSGTGASVAVNLAVSPAPTTAALSLNCSAASPTITPAPVVSTCTVRNDGQSAVSSISYSAFAGVTVSGYIRDCAAGANCGTVTVTTGTVAGIYSGNLVATPSFGSAASYPMTLVVSPSGVGIFSAVGGNAGGTSGSSVILKNVGNGTISGITAACENGSASISGSVVQTLAPNASMTLTSYNNAAPYLCIFQVSGKNASNSPMTIPEPALSSLRLLNCSSITPTMIPAVASLICTVRNTGILSVSSIAYSSITGATVVGPTGACAGGAICGTVTVTAGTAATLYSGTLTVTSSASSSVSTPVSLLVNTPPALSLTACTSTSPTVFPTAASMSCTLSNTGQTSARTISYGAIANATVSGPLGECFANSVCGKVSVTVGDVIGQYSGNLTATPGVGTGATVPVNLTVGPPAGLTLTGCTSTTPTTAPTPATMTCTLNNTGSVLVSSITYPPITGATVNGPKGPCAANATCGPVTVTSGIIAAIYSGTLTATPNVGTAGIAAVSLVVSPPPAALSLGACTSNSPTLAGTAATAICPLSNTGLGAASSISYSSIAGATVSGPASCAAGASCGNVTVTTATAVGSYSGTLTATPNLGSAGTAAISLSVNTPTPPTLSFGTCTLNSPTTSPTAATAVCPLSNTGQTAVSSIAYSFPSLQYGGANTPSVSGPNTCAANASCGNVTLTISSGSFNGPMVATPNAGTAGGTSFALQVNTPPFLNLTACTSTSPTATPTAATTSCTVSNSGQTAASSIAYAGPAGTTASGPTTCAASATCGTVTVTTGTAPATYSGTLTATPTPTGSAGSIGVSLVVNTVSTLGTFAVTGGTRGGPVAITVVQNTGTGTITGITASCQNSGFSGSTPSATTLAPGATLTVRSYDGNTSGTTLCKARLTGTNASNSPYASTTY